MEFHNSLILALATVFAVLVFSTDATGAVDAESWDLAVATGVEIEFFNRNGTRIRSSWVANAVQLTAFAYDSANRTLYMNDREMGLFSVYISNFTEELLLHPQLVLGYTDAGIIRSMVFDPVNKTLFWIDFEREALMKLEVSDGTASSSPTIVHDLRGLYPRSIALDICNEFIYWTTYNETASIRSIERSRLDGTDRRAVVSRDQSYDRVYPLAVDHYARKLYFTEDRILYYYEIDENNSAGKDSKVGSIYTTDGWPQILAADDTALYWIDSESDSIWKLEKKGTTKSSIKLYKQTRNYGILRDIIIRDNAGDIDCKAVFERNGKWSKIRTTTRTPSPITTTATATTEKLIAAADANSNQTAEVIAKIDEFSNLLARVKESFVTAEEFLKATVEAVVELSKRTDALSNQNQLLVTRIGILEDARKVQADEISRLVATTSDPNDRETIN